MNIHPNQILQGDCVDWMGQIKKGSIDLVFADPPFNIGYEYDLYHDKRSADEYLGWSARWIKAVQRCLKPTGSFWLAIGDEYAAELKVAAQQAGFTCRSWVIWYYTFGVNCARGFSRSHTHLFHFVMDADRFTFNGLNPAVRVPSARQLVYADGRANPKGRLPDNTWIMRPQDGPADGFGAGQDTWYFARVAGTFRERQGFHGCQMPEQLLGRIIRVSSNLGDLVLDPFAGSGTTVTVAKKLGRQWLGIELSPDYVEQIETRLAAAQVGDDLDGPANPVQSAPTSGNGKTRYSARRRGQTIPLPRSDDATEQKIVNAFRAVSKEHSADYLLCDPHMRDAFCRRCKQSGLTGSEFFWNRLLLRLRKAGRLPKSQAAGRKRLTFTQMDAYSFASEIALRQLEVDFRLAADDVLCSPDAVAEFDRIAAAFAPGHDVFDYRWAALAIRKRAKTSRRIALQKYDDWLLKDELPPARDLETVDLGGCSWPGVYILEGWNGRQALYVGETRDIAARVQLIRQTEPWQQFGRTMIRMIPDDSNDLHGLQSILVLREMPLLNSAVLCPDRQAVGDCGELTGTPS